MDSNPKQQTQISGSIVQDKIQDPATGDTLSSIKSQFGSSDGKGTTGPRKTLGFVNPQVALLTANDASRDEQDDQFEFFLHNLREHKDSQKDQQKLSKSLQDSENLNLYKSCVKNEFDQRRESIVDQDDVTANSIYIENNDSALSSSDKLLDEIQNIITDNVLIPLSESRKLLHKTEGAMMPLTVTLHRTVAYKKFKMALLEKLNRSESVNVEEMSALFCKSIDRDVLDKQFYNTLVAQYARRIREYKLTQKNFMRLPETLQANIKTLEESAEYKRLVQSIASWYALMELCEDLIERVKLYGISQYLDEEAALQKLEQNWCISEAEDHSFEKQKIRANGFFASCVSSLFNQISHILMKIGVYGAAHGMVTKQLMGYVLIHPGYFMSAIVSSAVVKMGAEQVYSSSVLEHVEHVAELFTVVTSNLMNQYHQASEIVATSFTQKNPRVVHDAISALIQGHNKSNRGTLQHIFDEKDQELAKLKMEELKLSMNEQNNGQTVLIDSEWINVKKME